MKKDQIRVRKHRETACAIINTDVLVLFVCTRMDVEAVNQNLTKHTIMYPRAASVYKIPGSWSVLPKFRYAL